MININRNLEVESETAQIIWHARTPDDFLGFFHKNHAWKNIKNIKELETAAQNTDFREFYRICADILIKAWRLDDAGALHRLFYQAGQIFDVIWRDDDWSHPKGENDKIFNITKPHEG